MCTVRQPRRHGRVSGDKADKRSGDGVMKQMLRRWSALMVLVALVLLPALAQAQGDARFTGTVLDQTGAFVAGANVVVVNERTGEERTVVSGTDGRYVVPGLRPASYTIRVTYMSFAPIEYTGMQ